jgi:ribonuclease HII
MLTIGIDDAGRGPLIGPMILAGVLLSGEQERKLKKENIKDSKILTHIERVRLGKIISGNVRDYKIVKTFPKEIDDSENLNTLEAKKSSDIINAINTGDVKKESVKVVVDCPSVNTESWQKTMEGFIKHKDNLKILCEHKADANHLSVSAASILAKNMREEEVAKIKKEFGNIGSGYPSDPQTKKFLKESGEELKDSGIFRKSWITWKKMFPENGQMSLSEF